MSWSAPEIPLVSNELAAALAVAIDQKTKPLGSLGRLETLALQIGVIQNTLRPELRAPAILVFAGDHGLAVEGVSPYPQDVTAQMVLNFLRGGAAISVFARQHRLALHVIDAGVASSAPFDATDPARAVGTHFHSGWRVRGGTRNSLVESAMTQRELNSALCAGEQIVENLHSGGTNVALLGEMGIGNTSAAALLMSSLLDEPVANCVGRGAGHDDAGLSKKVSILARVQARHASTLAQAQEHERALLALKCFGGYEIAMMVGAILRAAALRMVIVNDGFITTAAVAVAAEIDRNVLAYVVSAHESAESAHARWLKSLGLVPLLSLGLRLGEGSGAALAWPLLQSAVGFLNEMATFASAGVSEA